MNSIIYSFKNFLWEHVKLIDYKKTSGAKTFEAVNRQNIIDHRPDIGFDLRYFECGPSGYTTLEKHEHTHVVMVLRGNGLVLIQSQWHELKPFDCFVIPSYAVHQLKNSSNQEPFGFICIVNQERDPYQLLSKKELTELLHSLNNSKEIMLPDEYYNEIEKKGDTE